MTDTWLQTMAALYGQDHVAQITANPYSGVMTDPVYKFREDTYAVFGVLKGVMSEGKYLRITNDKGITASMSKQYYSWKAKEVRLKQLIDHAIVTRTGAGWHPQEWFSSVYPLRSVDITNIADDAGPQAQEQLIKTKIAFYETKRWYEHQLNQTTEQLEEEAERYRKELEQLTPRERAELLGAAAELDKDWPNFVENPNRALGIIGAGYFGGKLGHIDKYFAMRLGIDTTQRKRIQVEITNRAKKNYVRGTLPEYHDQPVVAALKKSRQADTKGQWVIASIEPGEMNSEYFQQELSVFPQGVKDLVEPLEFWMEHHKIIWDKVNAA